VSKSKIVFPSFEKRAIAIQGALEMLDKASADFADAVKAAMQGYVDEVFLATGKRDQATCTMLGKMIRECEVMEQLVMDMRLEKNTVSHYAQGAMRALHYNIEWSSALFQDAERKLPWSKKPAAEKAEGTKGSATDVRKAGKVQTTTDAELIETMRKAIQQARLLNRHMTVGLLIDAAQEIDATFKE
jgi:hypothetical protein